MTRCPWCGAKNYAIDMWCTRCSHHLDWVPLRRRPSRIVSFLATTAAVAAVAIVLAIPVAGWFDGTESIQLSILPTTAAAQQASNAVVADVPAMPSPSVQATPTPEPTPSLTPDSAPPSDLAPVPEVQAQPAFQAPPPSVLTPSSTGDPAEAVQRFYSAVSAHQFDVAASLWSPAMQAEYPPTVFIDQRFSATQQIDVTTSRVLSDAGGIAVVYVDVLEVIGGERRQWVGTWQLIDSSTGWLLNSSNLQAQD